MPEKKYIVYRKPGDGFLSHIIFDKLTNHSDFSNRGTMIGAGLCKISIEDDFDTINDGPANQCAKYKCYGKSVSLNISSRGEEDAKVLNRDLEM